MTAFFVPVIPADTKNIREYVMAHPMQIGTAGMRSVLRQLQDQYPDARIGGSWQRIPNQTQAEIREHNRQRRIAVERVLADPGRMKVLDEVFDTSDLRMFGDLMLFRDVLRALRRRSGCKTSGLGDQQTTVTEMHHRPCRNSLFGSNR